MSEVTATVIEHGPEFAIPEPAPAPAPEPEPEPEPASEPEPAPVALEPADDDTLKGEVGNPVSDTDPIVECVEVARSEGSDGWIGAAVEKDEKPGICSYQASHMNDTDSLRRCEICRELVVRQALSILDLDRA